ncbi:MAG: hypothetical protein KF717_13230 [Cyclobacteriaceae bacterium]|nr:hypothetical protein [Cyclobacteriaceae bacterium]MCB9236367.1 hypothetical protein [Flammeovirgaceae bacterium]
MKYNTLLLILWFVIGGCDPHDGRLTIVNESKEVIFISLSPDGMIKEFPIKFADGDTLWNYTEYILPGEDEHPLSFGNNSWEKTINEKYRDSTLTLFIFDRALLKITPPDSLVAKQLYSRKFAYKVKDLEKLNWRIEYKE